VEEKEAVLFYYSNIFVNKVTKTGRRRIGEGLARARAAGRVDTLENTHLITN